MSPRKSSTSSGRPSRQDRPRYLGIEVAGEHLPPSSSRGWEELLALRLHRPGESAPPFRVVRSDGRRAIVAIGHRALERARAAWNGPAPGNGTPELATRRTWGTLVGAKEWMRGRSPTARDRARAS